tara:strand:+ start:314 stop:2614 length:2301 start_codon:yes stop_codon:yes gene_type:complete
MIDIHKNNFLYISNVLLLLFFIIIVSDNASAESYKNYLFDMNSDDKSEFISLSQNRKNIYHIESSLMDIRDTIWEQKAPEGLFFYEIILQDIDDNGQLDIISVLKQSSGTDKDDMIYIFQGSNTSFFERPSILNLNNIGISNLRIINIFSIRQKDNYFVISAGTPQRKVIILELAIIESQIIVKKKNILISPLIENGYGHVYAGSFQKNNKPYILQFSTELNNCKASIYDVSNNYKLITTDLFNLGEARGVNRESIKYYKSKDYGIEGLLVSFKTGEHKLFYINDENSLKLEDINEKNIYSDYLKLGNNLSNFGHKLDESKNKIKIPNKLSSGPTFSDFLKNDESLKNDELSKEIPTLNDDMSSADFAIEAGVEIEKSDLTSTVEIDVDSSNARTIPDLNDEILSFSNDVFNSISNDDINLKNDIDKADPNSIDLYYVMVMTPASDKKDRFTFDGEAPFGVVVNQLPQIGKPTHYQHSVSANLAHLQRENEYDFAYTLKDGQPDSVTTLIMVHDMQTNIVFLSISPIRDSLSQSYQPEAFDPALYEFPDYFFEGFPTSLGMDFKDKLIRFSFNEQSDSTIYQGIYLSATTPSKPSQSLAVFLDEGSLQAIRGEVRVRENGTKKITTEFDITGYVEPSLMFSRLIEENFSDSLKVKLLQGVSLEEPMFGPDGQLPKVMREKRLPDVQYDQQNPPVPVDPLKGIFPEGQGVINSKKAKVESTPPKTQSLNPDIDIVKTQQDTLNLETVNKVQSNFPAIENDSLNVDKD